MKVIFHHRFYDVYTADPAAARGRMEAMVTALEGHYDFIEPQPASAADLERVHGKAHIQRIKAEPLVYELGGWPLAGRFWPRKRLLPVNRLLV